MQTDAGINKNEFRYNAFDLILFVYPMSNLSAAFAFFKSDLTAYVLKKG